MECIERLFTKEAVMDERSLTRRSFLGMIAAGSVVGACSTGRQQARTGDPTGPSTPTPGQYRESPMMAARVAAGKLPPLAQRLPKQPYIVRPGVLVDEEFVKIQPGKYGGTLQAPGQTIFYGATEPVLWAPGGFTYADGTT